MAGDLDLMDVPSIGMALDESDLSICADVERYSSTLSPAFASEVARDAKILFTWDELRAAQANAPERVGEDPWWR